MQRPSHDPNSHTFRGRSMREAVQALKTTLGPDAVIVGTRRGRDPEGRYVEITAVGQPRPAPTPGGRIDVVAGDGPAMGGRRGASAAYARTAQSTRRGAPTPELPPLLAALRGDPPAEKPFAERAAWLARQIEARTAEHARAAEQAPATPPQVAQRPPYHTVDALPAGRDSALPARIMSPAQAASELARPASADSDVQRLQAEVAALKALVGNLGGRGGPELDVAGAIAEALAPLTAQLAALAGPQTQLSDIRARIDEVITPAVPDEAPVQVPRPVDPARAQLVERLVEAGVPRVYAEDVERRARPRSLRPVDPLARVSQIVADDIDCGLVDLTEPGERRVLAFVGPTGVGKTTTVAKLAARARLAGRTVALVTVDTFRMAAVDQLARYAEVLEAPLRVVKSPAALGPTLAELADYDVVLVDTTGRNPRGPAAETLARFFPEGWGGDLVLTVACGTRERDAFATVDAFAELGYAALCVTKTDESDAPGAIYGIARRSGRPVAWITDGQMVPDDIEEADAQTVAARIVAHRGRSEVALGA